MSQMINHMQQAISRAMTTFGNIRLGLISSVTPADSTVKVLIQPENVEVGPVQYATPWIGWFAPPTPGQQCIVIYQEGSKDVPIGVLMIYFGSDMPAVGVVSGEAILMHKSGSYIKLSNAGKLLLNGNVEIDMSSPTINIQATETINIMATDQVNVTSTDEITITAPIINLDGNVEVSGTLTANSGGITVTGGNMSTTGSITATGNVIGGGISLVSHVHGGVETGGGETGAPV